jgi:hypothetical protein
MHNVSLLDMTHSSTSKRDRNRRRHERTARHGDRYRKVHVKTMATWRTLRAKSSHRTLAAQSPPRARPPSAENKIATATTRARPGAIRQHDESRNGESNVKRRDVYDIAHAQRHTSRADRSDIASVRAASCTAAARWRRVVLARAARIERTLMCVQNRDNAFAESGANVAERKTGVVPICRVA